jgi:multiple sugar transport system permease protein
VSDRTDPSIGLAPSPGTMQHVFDPELHRARLLEAERRARRRGWKRFVPRGWHLVLLPLSVIMVLPFVWMVLSSFMTNAEINHAPPALFPHQLNLAGYNLVLANSDFPRWFLNSVIVSGTVVASQLIMCSLAGYAFARINFRGRNLTLVLLLATALIPFQLTVIPTFLIFHTLGLINTLGALIVPGLTSALGIYLMSSFFQAFPKELEEAGRIDGCSRLGVYAKIVLPLAKPALAALAIITFIYAWNDLFWPLIAITSDKTYTLQVGLATFQGQHRTEWSAVSAGITLTTVPVLLVFLVGQKRFVQAITGAVKG